MEITIIILLVIILLISLAALAATVFLHSKNNIAEQTDVRETVTKANDSLTSTLATLIGSSLNSSDNATANILRANGEGINSSVEKMIIFEKEKAEMSEKRMQDFAQNVDKKMQEVTQSLDANMSKVKEELNASLEKMRADNSVQMEQMRSVVDEKLSATLETRLKTTFGQVREQLDNLFGKLGEMQTLAQGVTNLNKILGNIKTRGSWGEVSLDNLLSDILTDGQYARNVKIKKNSDEMVDFAIIMPGKNEETIYLPIDCKFPIEDYARLVNASEAGDKEAVIAAQKQLIRAVKESAKSIRDKYIYPPTTTDFAIMYLPNESLYAEVVRGGETVEELQTQYRIVVSGPSTITATLNSLQMGFKSLAFEKRSGEIRKTLIGFKTDFERFSTLLDKAKQKLEEAVGTIDTAQNRTGIISKRLSKIDVDETAVISPPTTDTNNG